MARNTRNPQAKYFLYDHVEMFRFHHHVVNHHVYSSIFRKIQKHINQLKNKEKPWHLENSVQVQEKGKGNKLE